MAGMALDDFLMPFAAMIATQQLMDAKKRKDQEKKQLQKLHLMELVEDLQNHQLQRNNQNQHLDMNLKMIFQNHWNL